MKSPQEASPFVDRHIGPRDSSIQEMLNALRIKSLDDMIHQAAPQSILLNRDLDLPKGLSEEELLSTARQIASQNRVATSFIGQGYYDCHTPTVIQRNVLENPGWYTAYTPYQAEISQGRMEALLNFQTMVMDLTGMAIANASLLDEGTAIAEAMSMCRNLSKNKKAHKFFVDQNSFQQSLEVIRTRAEPLGVEVVIGDSADFVPDNGFFAAFVQYPGANGEVFDISNWVEKCQSSGCMTIVSTDLLSLCLLRPPGEFGVDVVVGSSQRFGVPLGFGGPHAAFLATKDEYKRSVPGRIIGVSKDQEGKPALRLSLQTREQHIRREKATSNICTAQVLLAVMASMYAVYHGPEGLKRIAQRVSQLTQELVSRLRSGGFKVNNTHFFDTISVFTPKAREIVERAQEKLINLALIGQEEIRISFDETKTLEHLDALLECFDLPKSELTEVSRDFKTTWPQSLERKSEFLQWPVFNSHRSETQMLRYIRQLEAKDLSLTHSMIPLGSCTMKLNATTEMIPVTWPEFAKIHPFAPLNQAQGYLQLIHQLENWLAEITGFAGVSLQPNAGSQGEYAGLLVIRRYHMDRGESQRNICLIPSSAHGTNPASAVMAGMKVVVVGCDDQGNIDLNDLKAKAHQHKNELSALMVTYPSTHGVFEEAIQEICRIIHDCGGQVYMDGANTNALVGISRPGDFGADVCHLNLHKTFCIPHGGGGPGVGPIGVAAHLKEFLPSHSLSTEAGPRGGIGAVSAAPWGSAGILPISWAYIAMMGQQGLKKATQVAILNANYIAHRLSPHYDVLYKSPKGFVAHECIIDVRGFKASAGVTVDDIAKRLMDYGFHAPTMSWPVPGTLMIEPTESESKDEIDRFCEAMIQIRQEIREIEEGKADKEVHLLNQAPHTLSQLISDQWTRPYSKERAAFPLPWVKDRKFWPSVSRVDNAFGDRNLHCSCAPLSDYA